MNFARALIVCRNSSANLACSWSCQVSPNAANLACNRVILFWRSWLNRFSSSAKRRTSAGSMTAFDIALPSLRVNTFRPAGDSSWQAYSKIKAGRRRWPEPATRYQKRLVLSKGKRGMKYVGAYLGTTYRVRSARFPKTPPPVPTAIELRWNGFFPILILILILILISKNLSRARLRLGLRFRACQCGPAAELNSMAVYPVPLPIRWGEGGL